jgi:hypothetical protein
MVVTKHQDKTCTNSDNPRWGFSLRFEGANGASFHSVTESMFTVIEEHNYEWISYGHSF